MTVVHLKPVGFQWQQQLYHFIAFLSGCFSLYFYHLSTECSPTVQMVAVQHIVWEWFSPYCSLEVFMQAVRAIFAVVN